MARLGSTAACLFCLNLPQGVVANPTAKPVTVLISGSDIDTPAHAETRRLQDALVAAIDAKATGPAKGETAIYLPEDIRFRGRGFAYKAQLIDSESKPVRAIEGWCTDIQTLDMCAREIVKYLTK